MAYENGYEVIEYIEGLINAFERDQNIFNNTYSIIPIFTSRPDWPHCYNQLDNTISRILGDGLTNIIFGYTSRYLNDKNMIFPESWDDDLLLKFNHELQIFHETFESLVYQYGFGRSTPLKIYSVSSTYDSYNTSHLIKISRFDGTSFEFEADPHDISSLIRSLEGLEQNE